MSSGRSRGKGKGKKRVTYESGDDEEYLDGEDEYQPCQTSASSGSKRRAVRGKAKVDPKEVASVQRILARAERADLERLLVSHIAHGHVFKIQDLVNELPDCVDALSSTPSAPYVEAEADLGTANFITRDLLRSITGYLPLRSRLVLCDRVCKTWREWLSKDSVVFYDMKINMGRYSDDKKWLDADKVVQLFERAPPGSIQKLTLLAHDKCDLHKKHLSKIFKLHDRFTNLRVLEIGGERYANDIMNNIAIACTARLAELRIRETKVDVRRWAPRTITIQAPLSSPPSSPPPPHVLLDIRSIHQIIARAPGLLRLSAPSGGDTHTMGLLCEALEAARGGAPPLLEELTEGFDSWRMPVKPVSSLFRLFLRLPNLQVTSMSAWLPGTVELYRQHLGNVLDTAVFPSVRKLRLVISAGGFAGYGGYLNSPQSDVVNAFFADIARVFPNIEHLDIRNKRPYISTKDRKHGLQPSPNPILSGCLSFPKLTMLSFNGFDLWDYKQNIRQAFPRGVGYMASILASSSRPALIAANQVVAQSSGHANQEGEAAPERTSLPFALDAPLLTSFTVHPWDFTKNVKATEEERAKIPELLDVLRLAPLAEMNQGMGHHYF